MADTVDYPLHLGVTEAGPPPGGISSSQVAGIGTLLNEGIGETHPLLAHGRPGEAKAGRQLLEYLGLREREGSRPDRLPVLWPAEST